MDLRIRHIFRLTLRVAGFLFTVATVVLSFVSWDEIGIKSTCLKIWILLAVIVASFLIAIIIARFQGTKTVWKKGNASILLRYGDLKKIALPRKSRRPSRKQERIVVISVNTHYDTIVNNRIVSAGSVHGQWIGWMKAAGITSEELNRRIKEAAREQGIQPLRYDSSKQGNTEAYERGTIIELTHDNTRFFLLALSEFDENLNAQTNRDQLIDVIKNLITYYDKHGCGQPLYTPLIGTELSRVNITDQESLELITNMFQLYSDKIHAETSIVVYKKHRNQVSIFK